MFRDDLLKGRVALITGGGTGLGRAMAEAFVRAGARCVIAGRRQDVLEATAREIHAERVLPVCCDVRDGADVERLVDAACARFGAVDILVNNAAANFISPTEDLTANAFRLVSDIVWMGTVHCTLTLGKRWIQEGRGGTILNILTTYARTGSGYVVPSACAKAAVDSLTRSLAAEWGKYGIRVVGIAPGPFPTEGARSRLTLDEPWEDIASRRIALRRIGTLEEFGALATFLVSPQAGYISGDVVRIDGGEGAFLAGEFNFLDGVEREQWRSHRRRARGARGGAAAEPACARAGDSKGEDKWS
jgi:2,4-dienoyl-CoA reductase [(3E)-enoyl-CoA-producing], mitochondrial